MHVGIYRGQASCTLLNFEPSSAVDSRERRMESSETGIPDDANSPKRKKMRLWSPKIIKLVISVLTPFLLSPLAFSSDKVARCGFVILWMAIYWMLEPINIAVTALLPVALMPLLGILDAQEVAPNYMKEVLMMFMGGLGVAIAVEHSKLHERIALKVLLAVGADTKWLMLGFMLTTMFLSMWISNTATTAMMVPIISAVMNELNRREEGDESNDKDEFAVLHKTLLLSVAYSANTGGTGTITGTSPNMIFKGYVEDTYPKSNEITYASWMAYNVPPMIMVVLAAWLVLQAMYIPCWRSENNDRKDRIRKVISSKYDQLGRITFHEAGVLFLFIVLVLLFFFRDPKFMPGWASLIPFDTKIGDAVPAIGVLFLMFVVPAEPWKTYKSSPLLTWKVLQEKMPWGLIILLGGGYALADGAQKSGLSEWLGKGMSGLSSLPPSAILVIMWLFTTCSTEIMSNSTITAVTLPIVTQMALAYEVNPIYFMLPVTVISSQAFMLPVATGPNAIVYGTRMMKTSDMVKAGLVMNLLAGCIQLIMLNTYGNFLFKLNVFPDWANITDTNATPNTAAVS